MIIDLVIEGEYALTYELNKDGGIRAETDTQDLLQKRLCIIDMDDSIQVRQVIRPDMIEGIPRGIATVMEDMIPSIASEHTQKTGKPIRELTRRDLGLAFTKKGLYERKLGHIMPEKIDINNDFEKGVIKLGKKIVEQFHSKLQTSVSQIDTIFLAGDGSRVSAITDLLKGELSEPGYNKNSIVSVKDPVFANVKGYYYGLSILEPDSEEIME